MTSHGDLGTAFVRGVVSGLRPTILVVTLGALAGAAYGYSLAAPSSFPLERLGNVFGHVVAYGLLGLLATASLNAFWLMLQLAVSTIRARPVAGTLAMASVAAGVAYLGHTLDEAGVLRILIDAHPMAQVAAGSAALTGVSIVAFVMAGVPIVEKATG